MKNAFVGILVGIAMFFGSFALIWWNEGNAVDDFRSIGELDQLTVAASAEKVDPKNEGNPVHITAEATTEERLEDSAFGIGAVAIRLQRRVEMYQWEESSNSKSDSSEKTYSYRKVWSEKAIQSAKFNEASTHKNPGMKWSKYTPNASDVSFGQAFKLPEFLIEDLDNFTALPVKETPPEIPNAKLHEGGLYISDGGGSESFPMIGDYQVKFSVVNPGPASLIAKQVGNSFEKWRTEKVDPPKEKFIIRAGTHTQSALIEILEDRAKLIMWLLRGGGFLLMFFGILAIVKPISVIADAIPFIGNFIEGGIAIVAGLVAGILTLITIIIAWVAHRPVVALILLVGVGFLIFLLVRRSKAGKAARQRLPHPHDTPPPPPGLDTPPPPPVG